MAAGLQYRPDLDGLRAVAVLSVVAYHLGLPYVGGGFVGVDVFFVLSGFFITRQIVRDLADGCFSLAGFYDRRIRRLFPALIAMLLLSSLAAAILLLPPDLKRFGSTLLATALSVSNFAFWQQSGYFAPAADTQPLLHTWSLAVEEQFYVVFPLVLLLIWRLRPSQLPLIVLVLLAGSFGLSLWATHAHPDAAFYLLPMRAWELAIGALLALSIFPVAATCWAQNAAVAVGLAAIGTAVVGYSEATPFPGLAASLPCLGTALIIWAGEANADRNAAQDRAASVAARVLTFSPVVGVGLISYSLYLWHWPIIVFTDYVTVGSVGPETRIAQAAAMICIAWLSWRFVEQPLRSGARFWPTRPLRFAAGGAAGALVATIGSAAYVGAGFPQRLSAEVVSISEEVHDRSPLRARCHADGRGRTGFEATCVLGPPDGRPVVVWGDSHGAELSYALSEVAQQNALQVRQITASSCPPSYDYIGASRPGCSGYVAKIMNALQHAPASTVIIAAYYFLWADSNGSDDFWQGLSKTVQLLRQAGHEVVLVGDLPPHLAGDVPTTLAKLSRIGVSPEAYDFPIDTALARRIDAHLRSIAREQSAHYVPILPYLCGGTERCRAYSEGHAIFFDKHHMTVAAARRVVSDLLLPLLRPPIASTASIPN